MHTAPAEKNKPEAWHGLNPKSGEVVRSVDWEKTKHRCFSDKATERYIMSGGMDFLDVKEGKHHTFRGGRGNCSSGFTPANGFLYQHPNVCVCASQVRGFVALAADASTAGQGDKLQDIGSRQTGPGTPADETPSPDDWPMLRHDPARSGSTTAILPLDVMPIWEEEIGGRLSSPVVACGKVFVASIDDHRVIALDMKTGKTVWSYRANGRVDSPPTIYAGRAIFGDRDGWVHCVSAATGELIWSLQAAPRQRWLVCQGQVESAWPVHGSVLIDGDTAYFAAGRHTEVDGGILLCAVSPRTGKILWREQHFCSEPTQYGGGSITNDILVSDGQTIARDNAIFDSKTGSPKANWRTGSEGVADFFWGGPVGFLTDISRPVAGWHELHHRSWAISSVLGYQYHSRGLTLAFAGQKVFGVRVVGERAWKDNVTSFEVFSCDKAEGTKQTFWQATLPKGVLPKALLHAGGKLYIAAESGSDEPGKGTILIYDAKDGRDISTIPLNVRPKFDGLAAVNGNLIVIGQDGKVVCLGKD